MSRRNPYVTYFPEVKRALKAVEQSGASDQDEFQTQEQQDAIANAEEVLGRYLLDSPQWPVNKRGLNTLSRNNFPAGDVSGQPSNPESDGAYHAGAQVRAGEYTLIVERDDC